MINRLIPRNPRGAPLPFQCRSPSLPVSEVAASPIVTAHDSIIFSCINRSSQVVLLLSGGVLSRLRWRPRGSRALLGAGAHGFVWLRSVAVREGRRVALRCGRHGSRQLERDVSSFPRGSTGGLWHRGRCRAWDELNCRLAPVFPRLLCLCSLVNLRTQVTEQLPTE